MGNSNSSNNRIGFLGLLGIAFIVLKLTKVINWSWWWVTLPLWCEVAIILILLFIALIIEIIKEIINFVK